MAPSSDPLAGSPRRGIRSFVIREGRLTGAQERALQELSPLYAVNSLPLPPTPHTDPLAGLAGLFARRAPCYLEIGCGNGDTLLSLAQNNPQNNYLGFEVHRPGVGNLLRRVHQQQLQNVRIATVDIAEALPHLPAAAFTAVYILFPDPWPKKRHHKRRLIQPEFISTLREKLCAPGNLYLATDDANYAAHIDEVMTAAHGWVSLAGAAPTMPRPAWRPLTRFEARGLRLGHTVRDFAYAKITTR